MIHSDKPSLPICALGAGAAHVAMLALVLPVMITLPASHDRAQGTVAIQVVVRSAPPPFIAAAMSNPDAIPEAAPTGEGDVDDTAWTAQAAEEVTGALPERAAVDEQTPLIEEAALTEPVGATPPEPAAAPVEVPDAALSESAPAPALEEEDVELDTVASIEAPSEEPDFMPDVVPRPLRKPSLVAVQEQTAKPAPAPPRVSAAPPRAVAATPRARPTTTKPFKGFLGGTRATPMEEFPFRAGR